MPTGFSLTSPTFSRRKYKEKKEEEEEEEEDFTLGTGPACVSFAKFNKILGSSVKGGEEERKKERKKLGPMNEERGTIVILRHEIKVDNWS